MKNTLNFSADIEKLNTLVTQLTQQLQDKNIELAHKEQKIQSLEYQLKSALQFRFGKKSEKSATHQFGLFDEALMTEQEKKIVVTIDEEITVASFTRKKGGRKPLPQELSREQIIHDLPETEKVCACGHALHKVGEDRSEQLEFIPAQVKVLEHIRYKYGCRQCEEGVKIAPLPPQPIPKSIATAGLLAHILVSKYNDHIPLYRQEHILQRYQIDIARSTLCHWVLRCGELIEPLIDLIKHQIINSHYICVDETPVQVLKNNHKNASRKNYMWVYLTGSPIHRLILYDYQPSRSSASVTILLNDFKGYLQTDGYAAYHQLQDKLAIIAVGCWAHVRRKFMDIVKANKNEGKAFEAIKIIKQLYQLEKQAREEQLNVDEIKKLRQEKAKPIIHHFKNWLDTTQAIVPPQSPLAKAIQYALNQWHGLLTYLDNGELMIGRVENWRTCRRREVVYPSAFTLGRIPLALTVFPVPARQTGRAVFPHPAFVQHRHAFAFGTLAIVSASL